MKMTVVPQQIVSEHNDGAYLNMLVTNDGGVGVWRGLHLQPVYLLAMGNVIHFITFDNLKWAQEWLEQHEEYTVLWKFEPEVIEGRDQCQK